MPEKILVDEKQKQKDNEQSQRITTELTEEEKTNIAENIIKEIEIDKLNLLKEEKTEITPTIFD